LAGCIGKTQYLAFNLKGKMNTVNFMKNYCDFTNPHHVWIMTGMSRNKDNNGQGERFLRRLIVHKEQDIETCQNDILRNACDLNTIYRLYISLNSRDVVNSCFTFQKKLIDISLGLAKGHEDALVLSTKIGSIWKTELAQKCNRGTKRILLDVDNCQNRDKIQKILDYLFPLTTIHCAQPTVSGYAIVFNACDTRGLMLHCKELNIEADLQRDSIVFVDQWKGVK
jgi:hypothetical protein